MNRDHASSLPSGTAQRLLLDTLPLAVASSINISFYNNDTTAMSMRESLQAFDGDGCCGVGRCLRNAQMAEADLALDRSPDSTSHVCQAATTLSHHDPRLPRGTSKLIQTSASTGDAYSTSLSSLARESGLGG
jgi:hypothetical protein